MPSARFEPASAAEGSTAHGLVALGANSHPSLSPNVVEVES